MSSSLHGKINSPQEGLAQPSISRHVARNSTLLRAPAVFNISFAPKKPCSVLSVDNEFFLRFIELELGGAFILSKLKWLLTLQSTNLVFVLTRCNHSVRIPSGLCPGLLIGKCVLYGLRIRFQL